ncbi:unnamed protein product [Blepharisma stoltei]|uniref:Uncharacterized protein n=1 Tax=Blepharisma stoltei TaxID=1481888 RepID=A0AAU9K569_9CILI|nr:unnamed protein product [Blepharisma stoltei]
MKIDSQLQCILDATKRETKGKVEDLNNQKIIIDIAIHFFKNRSKYSTNRAYKKRGSNPACWGLENRNQQSLWQNAGFVFITKAKCKITHIKYLAGLK